MKNSKPLHFLVLKIIGAVLLCVTVVGFVFVATGFGDFSSNKFMVGTLMATFGLFGTVVCLVTGCAGAFENASEIGKVHSERKQSRA